MRPTAIARQVYVDLVRRRSTVQVLPAKEVHTRAIPIFLLGLYRSGTTLLRYVVDSHPEIACPPESDFIQDVAVLLHDERAMRGLASMGYDEDHVRERIAIFADYFFSNYAKAHNKPRWADKSPSYVEHIDLLLRLFPNAQFICLHRHPLDQVHSHTKGGTFHHEPLTAWIQEEQDLRIAAAHYWATLTSRLLEYEVHPQFHSLRYEDLCRQPEVSVRALADHLNVSWSPKMLRFSDQPHDFGREATSTRATRGFVQSTGGWRVWPAELVEEVWEVVAEPATKLGYHAGNPN